MYLISKNVFSNYDVDMLYYTKWCVVYNTVSYYSSYQPKRN